jgi:hypothetical protein
MNPIVKFLIIFLEIIFGLGLFGCLFVLVLATIDDVKVLFHGNDSPHKAPATASGD